MSIVRVTADFCISKPKDLKSSLTVANWRWSNDCHAKLVSVKISSCIAVDANKANFFQLPRCCYFNSASSFARGNANIPTIFPNYLGTRRKPLTVFRLFRSAPLEMRVSTMSSSLAWQAKWRGVFPAWKWKFVSIKLHLPLRKRKWIDKGLFVSETNSGRIMKLGFFSYIRWSFLNLVGRYCLSHNKEIIWLKTNSWGPVDCLIFLTRGSIKYILYRFYIQSKIPGSPDLTYFWSN